MGVGVPLLGPADVGRRVSVRVLAAEAASSHERPTFRDVVGTLVGVTGSTWTVRRRDGTDVSIGLDTVAAARLVPESETRLRRAADVDPATLEHITSLGWQPLESHELGGWLLRAAGGFTGRANSVLALGEPDRPLSAAVDEVARWYRERGLVPTFQVPMPWAGRLDEQLESRGWVLEDPVRVLVVDVTAALMAVPPDDTVPGVELADRPDAAWLSAYRYRGAPLPAGARDVLLKADAPVFGLVRDPSDPTSSTALAVGRGALTPGWLGITAIDVVDGHRRRGLGAHLVRSLLSHAQLRGARFAYLQVAEDNAPARALYARFGFVDHHGYHYRRLR
ncbi:MAG: GNAT family N-acetyltransferase [Actinomycetes bacterium]